MKQILFILLSIIILFPVTVQAGDAAKNIPIKDMRKKNPTDFWKQRNKHKTGDLVVERVISSAERNADGNNAYRICFFTTLQGETELRLCVLSSNKDFDQAQYVWENDKQVSVILVNSKTLETAQVKLTDPQCKSCSAGIVQNSLKGF